MSWPENNAVGPISKSDRQRGFSLVELIAALAVATVGLLGVVQGYLYGLERIRTLREREVAMRVVQNEIEALRATPFAKLEDGESSALAFREPDLEDLVNATVRIGIRTYDPPALRLKEVAVSLRWTGENGRTLQHAVTTLIVDKEAAAP